MSIRQQLERNVRAAQRNEMTAEQAVDQMLQFVLDSAVKLSVDRGYGLACCADFKSVPSFQLMIEHMLEGRV